MITNSSLRTKISFAVELVIFIVLGTSTFVHIQQLERDYLQAIEWRAEALSQGILNQIMNNQEYDPKYYIHNPGLLGVFSLQCMQLYERNRAQNVAHISIINAAKIIAAHNDGSLWNTSIENALLHESLEHQELTTVLLDFLQTMNMSLFLKSRISSQRVFRLKAELRTYQLHL